MSDFLTRWRTPLILGSLGLNLFLVGAVLPHLLDHRHGGNHDDGPPPGMSIHPRPLEELLPGPDAALLRNAIGNNADLRALEQQMRAAWADTRKALKTEPFDSKAFEASVAEVATARRDFEARRQAAIVDAVTRMSPQGRQRLANLEVPFFLGGHRGPPPPDAHFMRPDGPQDGGPDGPPREDREEERHDDGPDHDKP